MIFIDVEFGWKYGFPKPWDHEKKFEETSQAERREWLVSKGYPVDMAVSRHLRSWYWTEK